MSKLTDRFAALPRAAKWGLWAGVFFVGYFAVIEPVLERTKRATDAANSIQTSLDRERQHRSSWSDSNTPAAAARAAFGTPAMPGPLETRSRALYTRVNSILDKHGVVGDMSERRLPLRDERADLLVSPGQRLDRFILDLNFETTPETAAQILAELESAEEVAAVSRVQIRRAEAGRAETSGQRRVRVLLSPEAWVLVPGARS